MALDNFLYGNTTIRTAGTIADPLFCLNDVCDILDITSSRVKAATLCDDEKQAVRFAIKMRLYVQHII